ncbi:DUF362 domain-containing protein [Oceanidesulfovibrio indonesiensis]|uniref:DUF362 domain-containing protein n=1 Tax=Oceanidesulfovibrio indonesiensis TaxID=54767 RepID=A0A7M3MJB9_9BACT|nr:DUF362 domain-containing protein [Oceanidesulfovibrio indonesiensis]TVM19907.1 DUF362 domain-containing protein [Oceanidesulfovibrio indonesiensis]
MSVCTPPRTLEAEPPLFPALALVRQSFDVSELADPATAVHAELGRIIPEATPLEGKHIAITAGSRGIASLGKVLAATVEFFKTRGAHPFVFPAMGSHGGATAEGQREYLEHLGLSEERLGAPVRSSMEVRRIGATDQGVPVFLDATALDADHIVVVNRVKTHTKFTGRLESGMFKMLAVGAGKHLGAATVHREAVRLGLAEVITSVGRVALECASVIAGIGLVENAAGRLHTLRACDPEAMEQEEAGLLALSKSLMPRLPVRDIDLLVVDEIGKNISGTGMDTKVTGRNRDIISVFDAPDPTLPQVRRIVVRDLHPDSQGNALGIGFADFTTDRLVRTMDYGKTVTNALTGISPEKAAVPIHFPTDRECLEAALGSLGHWTPETVRVVRIRNTKHLDVVAVSPALLGELPSHCEVLEKAQAMAFDDAGNLGPLEP